MPERERQIVHLRNAGAIMRIRVTDAGSRDANQNVRRPDLWYWNVCMFQSFSDLSELYCSHHQNSSLVTFAMLARVEERVPPTFPSLHTQDFNVTRHHISCGYQT